MAGHAFPRHPTPSSQIFGFRQARDHRHGHILLLPTNSTLTGSLPHNAGGQDKDKIIGRRQAWVNPKSTSRLAGRS
jgi:hypothetical protein